MDELLQTMRRIAAADLPTFVTYLTIPTLIEGLVVRLFFRRDYPLRDGLKTAAIGLTEVVITGTCLVYLDPLPRFIERHAPFSWPRGPVYFLFLTLTCEFIFYYSHFISHRVRWFWNEHQVHHSSVDMNLFMGNRNGWTFLAAGIWIFALPFAALGFRWNDLIRGLFLILNYQFFIHTNLIGRLGPFEYILNTPSLHRVHHATQERYLDKNFGGATVFFDYLFGTLQRELDDEKPKIGLRGVSRKRAGERPIPAIVFHGWITMTRDFFRASSLRERLRALHHIKQEPDL